MKQLFLALLFATGLAFGQQPEHDYIKEVYAATALLYTQEPDGALRMTCTATVFEKVPKGYRLVTAAHCVASDDTLHERVKPDPATFFVTFDEVGRKEFALIKLIAAGYQHEGDDFSVLEIETPSDVPIVALGDDSTEAAGSPVLNIASPLGLGRQVFQGYISLPRLDRPVVEGEINWKNAMLIQIAVGGGSSGSAVISLGQHAIVGFLVGSISLGQSPNVVAIPVSRFKSFYESTKAGKYRWFQAEKALPKTLAPADIDSQK